MNNSIKNKDLNKLKSTNLDWNLIQSEMKNKLTKQKEENGEQN